MNDYSEREYTSQKDSYTTIQTPPVKRNRYWINALLFGLTILTTMLTGAFHMGILWGDIWNDFSLLLVGWKYSFAVLLILTSHEMGHYFAARWYGVPTTLPYYIPVPFEGFHFGTMGAFIKLKAPIPNRGVLMDIGAAGPLAGFIVSILFLFYGYLTLPDLPGIIAHVEKIHPWDYSGGVPLTLGSSLLFYFFNNILGGGILPMSEVYHFPFIFAGWIGFLVTALNLLPIGQLDGGHIVYALFPHRAKLLNRVAFGGLVGLTVFLFMEKGAFGSIWIPWMIILSFIGLRHPPTLNDLIPINRRQKIWGWVCLAIFVLCFIPLPIYF
ncbi:MAG: site-2 protease family protein [Calditrichaeota bacterium]|nr:MAG: site-2 protease family protein [Calditrichota bacterium]